MTLNLSTLKADLEALTEDELNNVRSILVSVVSDRKRENEIPKQITELQVQYLTGCDLATGGVWIQPTGAHDAYPKNWEVTHNSSTWVSLVDNNTWKPGVSGWRQNGTKAASAWIQPTGAHDAYFLNSTVTYKNNTWKSTVDSNVWEPGVFGWTKI